MRRQHVLYFLGIGVSSWCVGTYAQSGKETRPLLVVEEAEVDMGLRPANSPMDHSFIIRNVGTANLIVHVEKTSCGCISELGSQIPIKPGEDGRVTLRYSPGTVGIRIGRMSFTAYLRSNDPAHPQFLLTMKAILGDAFEPEPRVVDFGDVQPDEEVVLPLTVKSIGKSAIAFDDLIIEPSSRALSVVEDTSAAAGLNNGIAAKVVLRPTTDQARVRESLRISTRLGEISPIEIPIKASIAYQYMAIPETLLFGTVESGQTRTLDVEIRPRANEVKSLSAQWNDQRIQVRLEPEPEGRWRLIAMLASPYDLGKAEFIRTNIEILDPTGKILLRIPVRAALKPDR